MRKASDGSVRLGPGPQSVQCQGEPSGWVGAAFPTALIPVQFVRAIGDRWRGEVISVLLSLFSDSELVCEILAPQLFYFIPSG